MALWFSLSVTASEILKMGTWRTFQVPKVGMNTEFHWVLYAFYFGMQFKRNQGWSLLIFGGFLLFMSKGVNILVGRSMVQGRK